MIYLKWAKSFKSDSYNFGDDLGPYLVKKLTGDEIKHFKIAYSRIRLTKEIIYKIIKKDIKISDMSD